MTTRRMFEFDTERVKPRGSLPLTLLLWVSMAALGAAATRAEEARAQGAPAPEPEASAQSSDATAAMAADQRWQQIEDAQRRLYRALADLRRLDFREELRTFARLFDLEPRAGIGAALGRGGKGRGVYVHVVVPDGPSARAGIEAQDVLTQVGDRSLAAASDPEAIERFLQEMRQRAPGETVRIQLERDGKPRSVEVTLAEPASNEAARRVIQRFREDGNGGLAALLGLAPLVAADGSTQAAPPVGAAAAMAPGTLRDAAGPLAQLELTSVSAELGRYFGATQGVLVLGVPKGSDSAEGRGPREDPALGLAVGDVIVAVDGRAPRTPREVISSLMLSSESDPVSLELLRDRTTLRLEVARPKAQ